MRQYIFAAFYYIFVLYLCVVSKYYFRFFNTYNDVKAYFIVVKKYESDTKKYAFDLQV